jgi:hypothetical protein
VAAAAVETTTAATVEASATTVEASAAESRSATVKWMCYAHTAVEAVARPTAIAVSGTV